MITRAVVLTLAVIACCACSTSRSNASNDPPGPAPRIVQAAAAPAEDGQWTMPAKNYESTRYSGLTEITAENAKNLKLAWVFSTGTLRGHEAAPLFVKDTIYITTPYPNYLYALDYKTGAAKWKYSPGTSPASEGEACCDTINRGAFYDNGRLYFNTLDNQTVAVDAQTGKEVWKTKVGDLNKGETMTMAPLVVKGKVLVGNSGGEFGVRGALTALNESDGSVAWRAYTTGPDSDVLIGSNFKPFYAMDQGKDLGVKSWTGDAWKIGGGTVWGWISYDPALDLIYYGTANPGPWNPDARPGDNKWTCTLFARHPEDGQAVWAYQMNPHDAHDYDGVNESVLADVNINGSARKILMHPDRNGHMYVMDRTNGQVLSAEPFGYITTTTTVDTKTGKLNVVQTKSPGFGKVVRDVCPASPGAKDWQPSAYSYKTGYLYIPNNNLCEEEQGTSANYISGTPYLGMVVRMYAGPGGNRGAYSAFDPVHGKIVWSIKEKFPVWSGTMVTASNVAFYGTMDGYFKAVNAQTGQPLWQFKMGSGVISQPTTFKGPDGKQYVAVMSGVGGWSGAIVSGGLDPRDGTGALGFVNAMTDLPQYSTRGGTLYVFSL